MNPFPIVSDVLRPGEIMNIIGPTRCGLSMLALNLAAAVASGKNWLGKFPCKQGRVLFVDNELRDHEFERRCKALRIPAEQIERARLPPDDTFFEKLLACTVGMDEKYALVIIDLNFSGLDDNKKAAEFYQRLNGFADKASTSVALVIRRVKTKKTDDSGSSAVSRSPDTHFVLNKHEMGAAYTVNATVRSFPAIDPFAICFSYPHWKKYFS